MTHAAPVAESAKPVRKDERLAVRLTQAAKQKLESAAQVRGNSLSDFVVQSALEAAQTVIEQEERLRLLDEDRILFFNALDTPPEPNEALLTAAKRYKNAAE